MEPDLEQLLLRLRAETLPGTPTHHHLTFTQPTIARFTHSPALHSTLAPDTHLKTLRMAFSCDQVHAPAQAGSSAPQPCVLSPSATAHCPHQSNSSATKHRTCTLCDTFASPGDDAIDHPMTSYRVVACDRAHRRAMFEAQRWCRLVVTQKQLLLHITLHERHTTGE